MGKIYALIMKLIYTVGIQIKETLQFRYESLQAFQRMQSILFMIECGLIRGVHFGDIKTQDIVVAKEI